MTRLCGARQQFKNIYHECGLRLGHTDPHKCKLCSWPEHDYRWVSAEQVQMIDAWSWETVTE